MKSNFSLWGPQEINGVRRWGVNEKRLGGTYTAGPHNGFDNRADAVRLLAEKRQEERDREEELAYSRANRARS
jgi:hypothetical protein